MASPSLSQIGLLVIMTSAALGACDDSHPDATKNAASSSGNGAAVEVDGGEVDGGDVDRAADASIDRETTPPVDSGPAGADAASGCVGFCDDFDDIARPSLEAGRPSKSPGQAFRRPPPSRAANR